MVSLRPSGETRPDQYDLGMEYVGHVGPNGYDELVIRGEFTSRITTAFWIRDDHVVAGMHTNNWDAIDQIRTWIGGEADGDLRNPAIPLADLAAPAGVKPTASR